MSENYQIREKTMIEEGLSKLSSQLAEGMASMGGRIDTLDATLQAFIGHNNDRHSRTDERIEEMRNDQRRIEREHSEKVRDLHGRIERVERESNEKHSVSSGKIHRMGGMGAAALFIIPIIISLLMKVVEGKVTIQ